MNENRKKEITVFLTVLVVIAVTFVGGVEFLKKSDAENSSGLLADIAGTVQTQNATTTPTSTIIAVTSTVVITTSTKAKITTKTATTTTKLAVITIAKATTTPKSGAAATSTPALALAPKPTATTSTPKTVPKSTVKAKPVPVVATTTKALPYSIDTFSKSQGWRNWWGNFSVATTSLTIGAPSNGTSGGVLLGGTTPWSNYTFQATLNWTEGETFGLMARYTNYKNYTLCQFDQIDVGDVEIDVEKYVNGVEYTLAQGDVPDYNQVGGSDITAYIRVQGIDASCSFDNHVVSSAGTGNTLSPPYTGYIGFMTWDPSLDNSQIIVTSLSAASNY